jgi:hypothetical protein
MVRSLQGLLPGLGAWIPFPRHGEYNYAQKYFKRPVNSEIINAFLTCKIRSSDLVWANSTTAYTNAFKGVTLSHWGHVSRTG